MHRICKNAGFRPAMVAVAVLLLASCGGGGGGDEPAADAQQERKATSAGFEPPVPIPADAAPARHVVAGLRLAADPGARGAAARRPGADLRHQRRRQQTGNFIYDIWDPAGGLDGGHLTLPNGTATDIFCSSQLCCPRATRCSSPAATTGPAPATTNTGNNNSQPVHSARNTLTPASNMNRARWYSSSTTLLNGETYIQGGTGGTDRPEVRQLDGSFRLLTGANTSALDFMYPRNFVAPDGRVFGYDSDGPHVLRRPGRHRLGHAGRPVRSAVPRQRRQRGDVPPGPHPAVRRQLQRRGRDRHPQRRRRSSRRRSRCRRSAGSVTAHDPARRQGARHRRQPRLERS